MPKSKPKNRTELFSTRFSTAINTKVDPSSIAIGNSEAVDILFKDMESIEFVNEVLLGEDHKTDAGSGNLILTEDWAKTYASAVNAKPGFLYTKGHEDNVAGLRAVAGGYVVGAKVEGAERLLLRNRLRVQNTEVGKDYLEQLKREMGAGLLSTSTGDISKRSFVYNEETQMIDSYLLESVKNQTNAIVEHDMHASDAMVVGANFRIGVYKDNGDLITDKNTPLDRETKDEGDSSMGMKEHLDEIRTGLKAGDTTVEKLATEFGIEVLTDVQKVQLARLAKAEKAVGDIDAFIVANEVVRKANFAAMVTGRIEKEFPSKEAQGLAHDMFSVKEGTTVEVEAEITRLKSLQSLIDVQTKLASGVSFNPSGEDAVPTFDSEAPVEA